MLLFAAFGYIAGSLCVVVAAMMEVSNLSYWLVYGGLMLTGLGWGAVEAATNPLIATIYPEEKTHRLNILHAWWPAGIVVGGLMGVAITGMGLPWELNMFVLMLPALALAWMVATSTLARWGSPYRGSMIS